MVRIWKHFLEKIVLTTPIFSLREVAAHPDTGNSTERKQHTFWILDTPDWVNVIPLLDDETVLMIRQFRHGTGEVTLEIPGGMCDSVKEEPRIAGLRELREETGYTAKKMISLGYNHPNPAIQSNRCHTFLATGLERVGEQELDENEGDIEVVTYPLKEIDELIRRGEITHSLVIVAFHYLHLNRRHLAT